MLSSTTRPTAIARPPRVIKFSVMPWNPISRMPVRILSGMDMEMIIVGRSVRPNPLRMVGRRLMRKAKTAAIAKRNPSRAS